MTLVEIWLLALALAMDCFAVSIATGIACGRVIWKPMLLMAVCFGFFQAMMPVIGWAVTTGFSHLVEQVDHFIAFGILAFIGGKMIKESFEDVDHPSHHDAPGPGRIIILSVATSIDALAIGVSFACLGYVGVRQMAFPIFAIGLVSFLMSLIGLSIGLTFGRRAARRLRPELIGGIILVLIGVKILIEHLFFGG